MILAPTNGPIGFQPHGSVARMVSRDGTNTLAVGDVVICSYGHTDAVYPPTTIAQQELSPFSSVIRATGASSNTANGFIGVVIDLLDGAGANGTYVMVQFGGVVKAKATSDSATAIARGNRLSIHDSNGGFDRGGGAASTYPAAIALGDLAANSTGTILVCMIPTMWFQADV